MHQAQILKYSENSRTLQNCPLIFAGAIPELLFTLLRGGSLCIPKQEDRVKDLSAGVRHFQSNILIISSSSAAIQDPTKFEPRQTLLMGSEPLPAHTARKWTALHDNNNGYGSTETNTVATCFPCNTAVAHQSVGAGAAHQYWVGDALNYDRLVPPGWLGEVVVEGYALASCYLNNDAASLRAFLKSPEWYTAMGITRKHPTRFFRSGDLGRIAIDGTLEVPGRTDPLQVKLRLELGEIEAVTLSGLSKPSPLVAELILPKGSDRPSIAIFLVAPDVIQDIDAGMLVEHVSLSSSQKSSWYDTWRYAGSTESVFATQDQTVHQFLRKRVTKLYSMSSLLAMENLIDNVLELSIHQLHSRASRSEMIRLKDWTMFFAYEVVSTLALGHTTGFLQRDFEAISVWIDGAIAERCRTHQDSGEKPDFLQYFLAILDANGDAASDEKVASEIGNVLGAGADTTATSLMATLKYLIESPDDYRRVQQEVDDEHRQLNLGTDQAILYVELSKLPLLSAVIKETLRLHPAIVYQLPRVCPAASTTIGSYVIPAGVNISMSAAAVNRFCDASDADSWRPARWLEKESQMLDACVMTFGKGSRSCLGKNLALLEMYKCVASFVRNFDIELTREEERIQSY
ncbi:Cytochrome P450 monooxygenase gsfF [Fulvia fulva]|nr:Cytochrome P450 monooxygenase gsfF [Fulvia fulva]